MTTPLKTTPLDRGWKPTAEYFARVEHPEPAKLGYMEAYTLGPDCIVADDPPMHAALAAVKGLKRVDMATLKAVVRPPAAMGLVLDCLCILMGFKPTVEMDVTNEVLRVSYAETYKRLMQDVAKFLEHLRMFNFDDVPTSALLKLTPYIFDERFTPDAVGRSAAACRQLCIWIRAIYRHALSTRFDPSYVPLVEPPVVSRTIRRSRPVGGKRVPGKPDWGSAPARSTSASASVGAASDDSFSGSEREYVLSPGRRTSSGSHASPVVPSRSRGTSVSDLSAVSLPRVDVAVGAYESDGAGAPVARQTADAVEMAANPGQRGRARVEQRRTHRARAASGHISDTSEETPGRPKVQVFEVFPGEAPRPTAATRRASATRRMEKAQRTNARSALASRLPMDLIQRILSHLEPSDLLSVACVCRRLRDAVGDAYLWEYMCQKTSAELDFALAPLDGSIVQERLQRAVMDLAQLSDADCDHVRDMVALSAAHTGVIPTVPNLVFSALFALHNAPGGPRAVSNYIDSLSSLAIRRDMVEYDFRKLNTRTMERLRAFTYSARFNPAAMENEARVCLAIAQWILALQTHARAVLNVDLATPAEVSHLERELAIAAEQAQRYAREAESEEEFLVDDIDNVASAASEVSSHYNGDDDRSSRPPTSPRFPRVPRSPRASAPAEDEEDELAAMQRRYASMNAGGDLGFDDEDMESVSTVSYVSGEDDEHGSGPVAVANSASTLNADIVSARETIGDEDDAQVVPASSTDEETPPAVRRGTRKSAATEVAPVAPEEPAAADPQPAQQGMAVSTVQAEAAGVPTKVVTTTTTTTTRRMMQVAQVAQVTVTTRQSIDSSASGSDSETASARPTASASSLHDVDGPSAEAASDGPNADAPQRGSQHGSQHGAHPPQQFVPQHVPSAQFGSGMASPPHAGPYPNGPPHAGFPGSASPGLGSPYFPKPAWSPNGGAPAERAASPLRETASAAAGARHMYAGEASPPTSPSKPVLYRASSANERPMLASDSSGSFASDSVMSSTAASSLAGSHGRFRATASATYAPRTPGGNLEGRQFESSAPIASLIGFNHPLIAYLQLLFLEDPWIFFLAIQEAGIDPHVFGITPDEAALFRRMHRHKMHRRDGHHGHHHGHHHHGHHHHGHHHHGHRRRGESQQVARQVAAILAQIPAVEPVYANIQP